MNRLDKGITLRAVRGPKAARRSSVGAAFCLRLIPLTLLLTSININNATAYELGSKEIDWALVAMNHLDNLEETQCWVELIWKESRFNPKAINGSHYGLAQMRNKKVKDLSPRNQVRWHMRYIDHRYAGSACRALLHFYRYGWH